MLGVVLSVTNDTYHQLITANLLCKLIFMYIVVSNKRILTSGPDLSFMNDEDSVPLGCNIQPYNDGECSVTPEVTRVLRFI